MCAVSMVIKDWILPSSPNFIPWVTQPVIPPEQADNAALMLKVIELLEKLDKKLGLKDCSVAEPEKKALKKKLRKAARKA